MSDSLLEHLEKLNDLVQGVVRENNELKQKISQMEGTFGQKLFGNTNRKKLTAREVHSIRELRRSGFNQASIAQIYDINPATVSRIVRGQYHK
ncbi:DNA-binding protein [Mycobacterium paragordonae]|uniref:DNA-binding protein n=1 Tax=Mycobacterium paragordonae TaxID=1389713 RepID=A0AAJ1W1G7_9MYCO|nr:DNA-binding protein [Mycobacterium paragordonae]MDP7733686.1 DNA-binding protein [Mycobacterium paragordonae]